MTENSAPVKTRYFVDRFGAYIGGFCGSEIPADALEVPSAPDHASQKWDGHAWSAFIDYSSAAQAALADSDRTVLRCIERGASVPREWLDYRDVLRTIINQPGPLPIRPAYPS